jgi:uncharacterized protein YciI
MASAQTINTKYDQTLAEKLGADENGMKMYVLVILKTGSAVVTDQARRDSLFAGHMANINRLGQQKKLVVAGPLEKNEKTYRGIFILDVKSFDEANQLLAGDPTIREKIFDVEMFNWYGSAALPEYLDASEKVWKARR